MLVPSRCHNGYVNIAFSFGTLALGEVLLGRVSGHMEIVMCVCLVPFVMSVMSPVFGTVFGMARTRVGVAATLVAGNVADLLLTAGVALAL